MFLAQKVMVVEQAHKESVAWMAFKDQREAKEVLEPQVSLRKQNCHIPSSKHQCWANNHFRLSADEPSCKADSGANMG